MKNKWVWISLGVAAGGTGLFFLGKYLKDKYFPSGGLDNSNVPDYGRQTQNSGMASTSTPNTASLPPTPFKNNTEGNVFRGWINDNYPDYAREIDLDRAVSFDGGFNNTNIRKAWAKYGAQYQESKATGLPPVKPSGEDFMKLRDLLKGFNITYNFTTKFQITAPNDRPRIVIDFYREGLLVIQKDASFFEPLYQKVSGSWKVVNGNLVCIFNGKTYTITPSDNNAMWSMLKDGGYLSVLDGSFVPFEGQEDPNMYQETQMPSYIKDTIRNKRSLIGDLENELENF